MRAVGTVIVGLCLGLGLVGCGVPDAPRPTPTPATRPTMQLGCFRPVEAVPGSQTPPITARAADDAARAFYRMNGVTLAQSSDATGVAVPVPARDVRSLLIRRSDYGVAGSDVLAGRAVWLLGYTVGKTEPWSTFRPDATVYIFIDAQNAAPLIGCQAPPG